jgi:isoquinoline 1-oxidoreductase alpha subunit
MEQLRFVLNGEEQQLEVDSETPLLWVLRDHLGATGTKYGCGIAQCGACTVHLNGRAVRSCAVPASAVQDANVVTIEGLSSDGSHPLQTLWVEMNVGQCGYCQAGVLMAAADLLQRIPEPTREDIDREISNICRCGSYPRIRAAVLAAAGAS